MLKAPLDLAKARILLANDDGIRAPGLKVLERIARSLSTDVWVFAPETAQSGPGHSLSLHRPIRCIPAGLRRFPVAGCSESLRVGPFCVFTSLSLLSPFLLYYNS